MTTTRNLTLCALFAALIAIGTHITHRPRHYLHEGRVRVFGHVDGIDDTGGLVVRNSSGKLETLRSGEVFMVRQSERTSTTS